MAENNTDKLRCMCCLNLVPANSQVCPCCGYDGTQQNPEGLLRIGTRLGEGRYVAGRAVQIGRSTVDYVAMRLKDNKLCGLREYYPAGKCIRDGESGRLFAGTGTEEDFRAGLEEFRGRYSWLGECSSECALPRALDWLDEKGTAYSITDNPDGYSLAALLIKNGGAFTVQQTHKLMYPVLLALKEMHSRGLVHGGVDLYSILVTNEGNVLLRGMSGGELSADKSDLHYMAPELSRGGSQRGETIDVFSFAAVYYRCITGREPFAEGEELFERSESEIEESIRNVVLKALSSEPEKRQQSVKELCEELRIEAPGRKKSRLRMTLAAVAAAVILFVGIFLLRKYHLI